MSTGLNQCCKPFIFEVDGLAPVALPYSTLPGRSENTGGKELAENSGAGSSALVRITGQASWWELSTNKAPTVYGFGRKVARQRGSAMATRGLRWLASPRCSRESCWADMVERGFAEHRRSRQQVFTRRHWGREVWAARDADPRLATHTSELAANALELENRPSKRAYAITTAEKLYEFLKKAAASLTRVWNDCGQEVEPKWGDRKPRRRLLGTR